MAFSISNLCCPSAFVREPRNMGTLAFDGVLSASLVAVGTLLLTGVIKTSLLVGVGVIGNSLGGILIGVAVIVVVSDGLVLKKLSLVAITADIHTENCTPPALFSNSSYSTLNQALDALKEAIQTSYVDLNSLHKDQLIKESEKESFNNVFNGLFLGNIDAFVSSTNLDFSQNDPDTATLRPVLTSNPHHFSRIITLCPLEDALLTFDYDNPPSAKDCDQQFKLKGIQWDYLGQQMFDVEESMPDETQDLVWKALIHDCTYGVGNVSNQKEKLSDQQKEKLCKEKKTTIEKRPVKDWFERVFVQIDEAICNGERVLVHCQAGRSRSASVIAAYLIKRCGITVDDAINFLKSRRYCVQDKFVKRLREYEKALKGS